MLTDEEKERIKDVRAKMYYIYRPKTVEQYKVAACVVEVRGTFAVTSASLYVNLGSVSSLSTGGASLCLFVDWLCDANSPN